MFYGLPEASPQSPQVSMMESFEIIFNGFCIFTIVAKLSNFNVCRRSDYACVTVNTTQKINFSIKGFFS